MTARKSSSLLSEKIVPVLILVSVALAFGVGVLWQKVQYFENSGGNMAAGGAGTTTTVPNNNAGEATSVLNDLAGIATSLGVDGKKFASCVTDSSIADTVQTFYQSGVDAGVRGTPGSFIINSKGEVWSIPGAVPYASLKSVIDVALGKADSSTSPVEKMAAADAAKLKKTMTGDHIKGGKDSPVYIIEYSDFQCPYCKTFYPTAEQALSDYSGQIALVYRHFPLDQLHPLARPAAIASECVAKLSGEDAFWKFTDKVFTL